MNNNVNVMDEILFIIYFNILLGCRE